MLNKGYFNIKRDVEVTNAGGFFCEACLVGKPVAEQSSDPRYCQGCYAFLLNEAEILPLAKRPAWLPKCPNAPQTLEKPIQGAEGHTLIMSPINAPEIEVDIIQPRVASKPIPKRGPKHKALPLELIKQWSGEGMGSKAITSRLNNELGIIVSYKTIQRILSGERKQSIPNVSQHNVGSISG